MCIGRYRLQQELTYDIQEESQQDIIMPSPLPISVSGNQLHFDYAFRWGACELSKARLERAGNVYKVILHGNDDTVCNHIAAYHLSGTIYDISPGHYTLEIAADSLVTKHTLEQKNFTLS